MSLARLLSMTRPWKFTLQNACRVGFSRCEKTNNNNKNY